MICLVLPSLSSGGAERVIVNLANKLSHNNDVVLVLFICKGPLVSKLNSRIRIIDLNTIFLRKSLFKMVKVLNNIKPNVILSTLGYVNLSLLAIKPLLRFEHKILLREANLPSLSLQNVKYKRVFYLGYRYIYRFSDLVICSSKLMQAEFINTFKINNSMTRVLPNPVDLDLINNYIKNHIFNHPCMVSDKKIFVAAGRLTYQKGFDRLLLMFSIFLKKDKNAHLFICGIGEDESKLKKIVENLKIESNVIFLGLLDNPWSLFSMSDAFLLASRWEGMPNVALESLACGTKVISTSSSGGINEIYSETDSDAVLVVESESEFIEEMHRTEIKLNRSSHRTLLPDKFNVINSTVLLEAWMKDGG